MTQPRFYRFLTQRRLKLMALCLAGLSLQAHAMNENGPPNRISLTDILKYAQLGHYEKELEQHGFTGIDDLRNNIPIIGKVMKDIERKRLIRYLKMTDNKIEMIDFSHKAMLTKYVTKLLELGVTKKRLTGMTVGRLKDSDIGMNDVEIKRLMRHLNRPATVVDEITLTAFLKAANLGDYESNLRAQGFAEIDDLRYNINATIGMKDVEIKRLRRHLGRQAEAALARRQAEADRCEAEAEARQKEIERQEEKTHQEEIARQAREEEIARQAREEEIAREREIARQAREREIARQARETEIAGDAATSPRSALMSRYIKELESKNGSKQGRRLMSTRNTIIAQDPEVIAMHREHRDLLNNF